MKGKVVMEQPLMVHYRMDKYWGHIDYHSHQEYEIYFFHAGSCRYLIHDQIYDLEPGDILLMDGMALHKPNTPPNSEYIRSTIHFSPQWIEKSLDGVGGGYLLEVFQKLHHCLIRTRQSEDSKELERLIQRLEEVYRKTEIGHGEKEAEAKILLMQILVAVNKLGELDSLKKPRKKPEKETHAENIASYIQANFQQKLSIVSIAEALNLSKSYASHVFKEMTGFTIMEYVMGCRLNRVKQLLVTEPDKALKDVASESGFESVSHFSRYFREKVGMTAKVYRNHRQLQYSEEKKI
ncbi:helix-turn-helix domain-containing protein [Planococcus sp. 107-1]|uniref:helix-turn-helix transcriptional regulator n=1 Tax=Planococcus sp. 107-1 TaxID=2908840 RepID=UPI001F23FC2D|nr:helix-turn-helix domain-containing protein [Planococcus sp. 107-1]UJF26619.1 AraC family transcriptional regulator [Planococcus sp. 107-1]